jgi:F0F1-type ATP synthase assembly protein I
MNGAGTKIPREMIRYAILGVEFSAIFMIFLFGGMWLDRRFKNTVPWLTLLGMVLGFSAGMYRFMRVVGEYRRSLDDKTREPKGPPGKNGGADG